MAGATSNIREGWDKVSPRTWQRQIKSPARFFYDIVDITIVSPDCWQVHINEQYIATFNTWEEAAGAAPMLYQLHKDTT